MKKRLIKLLAFVLVLTFALAPVTANADSRLGTSTVSTGANLAVLPTTVNPYLIPVLDIPATLPQDQLIHEIMVKFNSERNMKLSGRYQSMFDSGLYVQWTANDAFFYGHPGNLKVTFYYPITWDPRYADETPWYVINFKSTDNAQGGWGWGCGLWYEMQRSNGLHFDEYWNLVGEGPEGITYDFDSWGDELTFTIARPSDRNLFVRVPANFMVPGTLSGPIIYIY